MNADNPKHVSPANARLVAVTRRLIEELLASNVSDEVFERAATLVAEAVDAVSAEASERAYVLMTGAGPYAAFTGILHPIAPPIHLVVHAREPYAEVTGTVSYGFAYEGPPGCVHGGFIAAGFDEMLGLAQSTSQQRRMTGQLDITYRNPTPLRTELRYAARIERVEGRKAVVSGTLHAGDVLCAEACGLFIAPREGRLEQMVDRRSELQ